MDAKTRQARAPVSVDVPMRIERFTEIDSTTTRAHAEIAAARPTHTSVFIAARQSAGVGRFGRPWSSPEGGLWMTLAWPAEEDSLEAMVDGLGLRVGVACLRVIRHVLADSGSDPHVRLKWPNDILVHGRKVLGVLTEVVHEPAPSRRPWVLVGVGVNANFRVHELPDELRPHATTLLHELGRRVDLNALEVDLLNELRAALSQRGLARETILEAAEHLHGLGRDTTVSMPDGQKMSGVLTGLNEHGMAVLDVAGRVYVPPMGSMITNDDHGRA